ncbi:MAG: HAD family phosphatase [Microbacteriaceae bacterium]
MTLEYPAAVLWDLDGTLVDTEPYWMRAEEELVSSFGGEWTHQDALVLVGSGLWVSAGVIQSHGVELSTDAIVARLTDRVQEQIEKYGVPWRSGAYELLEDLKAHRIPTALVTMSIKRMAEQIVSQIPFHAFDVLITGDLVDRPKPDPEAYRRAAELLGVDPAKTVAIEDSIAGLASAISAGTVALSVPHMVHVPEADTHTTWTTLSGRNADDLARLLPIPAGSGPTSERP